MTEIRDRLLRVNQVCTRMGCSKSNVYALIAVGKLDVVKVGVSAGYRVPESSVERYLRRDLDRFYSEE